MNQVMTNHLTEILTNISELQADLLAVPETGPAMDRLAQIRQTALAAMKVEYTPEAMDSSHRKEALDMADRLYCLMVEYVGVNMPDSVLLRIGAAADNLACQVRRYVEVRNSAAVARMLMEEKKEESPAEVG